MADQVDKTVEVEGNVEESAVVEVKDHLYVEPWLLYNHIFIHLELSSLAKALRYNTGKCNTFCSEELTQNRTERGRSNHYNKFRTCKYWAQAAKKEYFWEHYTKNMWQDHFTKESYFKPPEKVRISSIDILTLIVVIPFFL